MPISKYVYNGDYEDLLDWIIESYPPTAYKREGYFAWLKDVRRDFIKSGKHFSDDIAEEMKQFWIDNELGRLGIPEPDERKIGRAQTYNSMLELGTFNTQDVYGYNDARNIPSRYKSDTQFRASIRRELQELVKEGKLERVSRGVYTYK